MLGGGKWDAPSSLPALRMGRGRSGVGVVLENKGAFLPGLGVCPEMSRPSFYRPAA